MERIWKSLENQVRKTLEYCEFSLMGDSGGSSEDQHAKRNVNKEGLAHEALDGNEAIHDTF
jgi:hypothetical protein